MGNMDNTSEELTEAILTITVEIGDGRQECIIVGENDDIDKLASEFCEKHTLNMRLQDVLAMHIRDNLRQVKDEGGAEGLGHGLGQGEGQEEGEGEGQGEDQKEREAQMEYRLHRLLGNKQFDLESKDLIRKRFEAYNDNAPRICPMSRKLVAKRGLQGTVYNRLHNYVYIYYTIYIIGEKETKHRNNSKEITG